MFGHGADGSVHVFAQYGKRLAHPEQVDANSVELPTVNAKKVNDSVDGDVGATTWDALGLEARFCFKFKGRRCEAHECSGDCRTATRH